MVRRVVGLPVLPRLDLAARRRRTMSRSGAGTMSGVTSSRSAWRRAFGITASRVASRCPVRPVQVRAARLPSLQDGELVAQDQDLCGLPCFLTPGQPPP